MHPILFRSLVGKKDKGKDLNGNLADFLRVMVKRVREISFQSVFVASGVDK